MAHIGFRGYMGTYGVEGLGLVIMLRTDTRIIVRDKTGQVLYWRGQIA